MVGVDQLKDVNGGTINAYSIPGTRSGLNQVGHLALEQATKKDKRVLLWTIDEAAKGPQGQGLR